MNFPKKDEDTSKGGIWGMGAGLVGSAIGKLGSGLASVKNGLSPKAASPKGSETPKSGQNIEIELADQQAKEANDGTNIETEDLLNAVTKRILDPDFDAERSQKIDEISSKPPSKAGSPVEPGSPVKSVKEEISLPLNLGGWNDSRVKSFDATSAWSADAKKKAEEKPREIGGEQSKSKPPMSSKQQFSSIVSAIPIEINYSSNNYVLKLDENSGEIKLKQYLEMCQKESHFDVKMLENVRKICGTFNGEYLHQLPILRELEKQRRAQLIGLKNKCSQTLKMIVLYLASNEQNQLADPLQFSYSSRNDQFNLLQSNGHEIGLKQYVKAYLARNAFDAVMFKNSENICHEFVENKYHEEYEKIGEESDVENRENYHKEKLERKENALEHTKEFCEAFKEKHFRKVLFWIDWLVEAFGQFRLAIGHQRKIGGQNLTSDQHEKCISLLNKLKSKPKRELSAQIRAAFNGGLRCEFLAMAKEFYREKEPFCSDYKGEGEFAKWIKANYRNRNEIDGNLASLQKHCAQFEMYSLNIHWCPEHGFYELLDGKSLLDRQQFIMQIHSAIDELISTGNYQEEANQWVNEEKFKKLIEDVEKLDPREFTTTIPKLILLEEEHNLPVTKCLSLMREKYALEMRKFYNNVIHLQKTQQKVAELWPKSSSLMSANMAKIVQNYYNFVEQNKPIKEPPTIEGKIQGIHNILAYSERIWKFSSQSAHYRNGVLQDEMSNAECLHEIHEKKLQKVVAQENVEISKKLANLARSHPNCGFLYSLSLDAKARKLAKQWQVSIHANFLNKMEENIKEFKRITGQNPTNLIKFDMENEKPAKQIPAELIKDLPAQFQQDGGVVHRISTKTIEYHFVKDDGNVQKLSSKTMPPKTTILHLHNGKMPIVEEKEKEKPKKGQGIGAVQAKEEQPIILHPFNYSRRYLTPVNEAEDEDNSPLTKNEYEFDHQTGVVEKGQGQRELPDWWWSEKDKRKKEAASSSASSHAIPAGSAASSDHNEPKETPPILIDPNMASSLQQNESKTIEIKENELIDEEKLQSSSNFSGLKQDEREDEGKSSINVGFEAIGSRGNTPPLSPRAGIYGFSKSPGSTSPSRRNTVVRRRKREAGNVNGDFERSGMEKANSKDDKAVGRNVI